MTECDSRRRHRRFPFEADLHYVVDEHADDVTTGDISEGGLSLWAQDAALKVGQQIQLTLSLPSTSPTASASSSSAACEIQADVVWRSDEKVGVQFADPSERLSNTLQGFIKRYFMLASAGDLRKHIDDIFSDQA